jgi:hypothetical protein
VKYIEELAVGGCDFTFYPNQAVQVVGLIFDRLGAGRSNGRFFKRFAQQPHDRLKVEEFVLLTIAGGVGKGAEGIVAVAV